MEIRKLPGTTLASGRSGKVIYTPPVGEQVIREKLANWEKYLHREDHVDPLIKMAIGHYQFEAIHPFVDGNGRTGRILNVLYLIEQGLLDIPILYLSRFIIKNKDLYYSLLLDVTTKVKWEPWILYILDAVETTADWTTQKIEAIQDLFEKSVKQVQEKLPKVYTRELVEVLFSQPYCRIANLIDKNVAKRETASIYLHKLVEIGLLQEVKVGREKLFLNSELLNVLNEEKNPIK